MDEIFQSDDILPQRQEWMAVLAKASAEEIEPLWRAVPNQPAWTHLRAPEIGMVMGQARARVARRSAATKVDFFTMMRGD